MPDHPLQNHWVFWDFKHPEGQAEKHAYGSLFREICDFKTVEDFWKYWAYIPRPSEVFNDGFRKKVIDGRMIKSLCLFRKNIKPEWEDPANAGGCEFHATRTLTKENVDQLWENLVFAVIGETIDENSSICGCRVVDSCKKGKTAYKVELWLKTKDTATCNAIKEKMIKVGLEVSGGDSQQPTIFDKYTRGK